MSQDAFTGLGLAIVLFATAAFLKLSLASERPAPLVRLLLCAWPLSALIGMGLVLVVLPMNDGATMVSLQGQLAGVLGETFGSTVLGLIGAVFTRRNLSKGAGAGIAAMGALVLVTGVEDGTFGGAGPVAIFSAITAGTIFFFRDSIARREMAGRKPAAAFPATDASPAAEPLPFVWGGGGAAPTAADSQGNENRPEGWGTPIAGPGPSTAAAAPPRIIRATRTPSAQPPLPTEAPYPTPSWARHALVAAAGAAAMVALVILAGGMAGERVLSAMLLYPFTWFPVPMAIGAIGGASVSLLIRGKLL